MEQDVFKILKERGLIDSVTSEEIFDLGKKSISVYIGFDPTSDSLHLGKMVGIMVLAWFQKCGHKPIAIAGGATGMIGDPSGKSVERVLLDAESIEKNVKGIKKSLQAILNFEQGDALLLNNYDWFQKFSFIEFLRDVGKYFRVGTMLAKESVKARLKSEEGMSYTEFSYQLLQSYDFLHLFDNYGVRLQMGGNDQWGNITAGTELVRKVRSETVYGLTFPLLTRSDGKKFGKSEEGAIWLNKDKLSPFDFYQYLYRLPDADIPKLLRMITFIDMQEIHEIEESMKQSSYVPNTAQKRLADEATRIVHGEEGLKSALELTVQTKPGAKTTLDVPTLKSLALEFSENPIHSESVLGAKLVDVIVALKLLESKGRARQLIAGGGLYLNNEKVTDEQYCLSNKDLVAEEFLLLGLGKKKKIVLRLQKIS